MYANSTATLENTQGFMKVGFKNGKAFWHCKKHDGGKQFVFVGLEKAWEEAINHYNNNHRL